MSGWEVREFFKNQIQLVWRDFMLFLPRYGKNTTNNPIAKLGLLVRKKIISFILIVENS